MKNTVLNSLGRLRVYLRLPRIVFRLDLAIPVVLMVYLIAHWMGR